MDTVRVLRCRIQSENPEYFHKLQDGAEAESPPKPNKSSGESEDNFREYQNRKGRGSGLHAITYWNQLTQSTDFLTTSSSSSGPTTI